MVGTICDPDTNLGFLKPTCSKGFLQDVLVSALVSREHSQSYLSYILMQLVTLCLPHCVGRIYSAGFFQASNSYRQPKSPAGSWILPRCSTQDHVVLHLDGKVVKKVPRAEGLRGKWGGREVWMSAVQMASMF